MKELKKASRLLNQAREKYEKRQKELEALLRPYLDFPFAVQNLEGEGTVVLNENLSLNLTIGTIFYLIEQGETITDETYDKLAVT